MTTVSGAPKITPRMPKITPNAIIAKMSSAGCTWTAWRWISRRDQVTLDLLHSDVKQRRIERVERAPARFGDSL